MGWKIHYMDVKTTFLNGLIEEDMYIKKPKGFDTIDRKSHVYRLKRVLYSLEQEAHAWFTKIDIYLTSLGFTKSEADEKVKQMRTSIISWSCKEDLAREFEMKDMGLMHYFLELEVWKDDGELLMSQGKYANEILKILCMESFNPMETPLVTNWRKQTSNSGEEVDATIYR
eukprot:PITA_12957